MINTTLFIMVLLLIFTIIAVVILIIVNLFANNLSHKITNQSATQTNKLIESLSTLENALKLFLNEFNGTVSQYENAKKTLAANTSIVNRLTYHQGNLTKGVKKLTTAVEKGQSKTADIQLQTLLAEKRHHPLLPRLSTLMLELHHLAGIAFDKQTLLASSPPATAHMQQRLNIINQNLTTIHQQIAAVSHKINQLNQQEAALSHELSTKISLLDSNIIKPKNTEEPTPLAVTTPKALLAGKSTVNSLNTEKE